MLQCRGSELRHPGRSGIRVRQVGTPEAWAEEDRFAVDSALPDARPARQGCEVYEVRRGEALVLRVLGPLDEPSGQALAERVRAEPDCPGVVIDLTGATLGSVGVDAIVSAAAGDRHRLVAVVLGGAVLGGAVLGGAKPEGPLEGVPGAAAVVRTERSALAWLRERGVDTGFVGRGPEAPSPGAERSGRAGAECSG